MHSDSPAMIVESQGKDTDFEPRDTGTPFRRRVAVDGNVLSIILFALFSRLLLVAIAFLSYATTANKNARELGIDPGYLRGIAAPLSYGDVTWYMDIARNGYEQRPFSDDDKANWSFYPLWPLVLRLCNLLFKEMLISGILASTAFFLAGLVVLYRLVAHDFGAAIGRTAAILVIVFPASYFFMRPGPESLFLFLSVGAFYLGKKKNWLAAGFLGGLATLTRLQGVLLLIPLAYMYLQQHRQQQVHNWRVLSLVLIPLAQVGFMLHLYSLTGDPFASVRMQGVWDNSLALPFTAMVKILVKPVLISYYGWDLTPISFLAAGGAVLLTLAMFKRCALPIEYLLYTILSVTLIISRGNLNGTLRFLVVVFPLFLLIALMLRGRKLAGEAVLYTFSALQIFYFLAFLHLYNWAAT